MKLIIVTGLSGSGKSTALHTLEDQGFYCIDNLPVQLLNALGQRLTSASDDHYARMAVGIDARNSAEALKELPGLIADLRQQGVECEMLFLEAQPEILLERFSETRRRHPLTNENRSLAEAIELEYTLLDPFLREADLRIDTTHTNVHELRDLVQTRVTDRKANDASVLLLSFGFKHGVPHDADFVFDVRCLPNPYWQPRLRRLTGKDAAVATFLEASPEVIKMLQDLSSFFQHWVPHFEADGRSYLTIAIGCTGGQHRSVYIVEQLRKNLQKQGRQLLCRHRELS